MRDENGKISDAAALDSIAARYKLFGQEDIFEDSSSTIEWIGDLIEETGRTAWFESAEYDE